jgi:hypothetical protein
MYLCENIRRGKCIVRPAKMVVEFEQKLCSAYEEWWPQKRNIVSDG